MATVQTSLKQLEIDKYKKGIDELDTEFIEQYVTGGVNLDIDTLLLYICDDDTTRDWSDALTNYYDEVGDWGNELNIQLAKWLGCYYTEDVIDECKEQLMGALHDCEKLEEWFSDLDSEKEDIVRSCEGDISDSLFVFERVCTSIKENPWIVPLIKGCYHAGLDEMVIGGLQMVDCNFSLKDRQKISNEIVLDAIECKHTAFVRSFVENVIGGGSGSFEDALEYLNSEDNYVAARILHYCDETEEALYFFELAAKDKKNIYKEDAIDFVEENYSAEDAYRILKYRKKEQPSKRPKCPRRKKSFFEKAISTIKKMF